MPSWNRQHSTQATAPFGGLALTALVLVAALIAPEASLAQPAPTAGTSLTDGSFERNGVRLHYRSQGTGEPLVLLSGGPGATVRYLLTLGELLPKTHRLIYLEQRGTDRSLIPAPSRTNINMNEAIDDLEALRQHLQVERLVLAGHSYGGMLAMAFAAKYPTRVARLILIGSGGPTMRFATYFGANISARLRYEEREEQRWWEAEVAAGRVSKQEGASKVQSVATPAYFYDRAKGLVFIRSEKPGDINVVTNELIQQDFEQYDVREGLSRLDAPVLVIHGHQDPIGDLTAEEIRASIRNVTVQYINRCGHFPWLEEPDAVRKAVGEFLTGASGNR